MLMTVLVPVVSSIEPASGPGTAFERPDGDPVLQWGLGLIMEDAADDEPFEVIVQFHDPLTKRTTETVEALGFEVYREIPLFDALFMEGAKASILTLAGRDDVEFIEYNAPMQNHMNLSAKTISATDVWNRQVLRDDGEETIDGTGVTVVVLDSGIDGTHPDLPYTPVNIEGGSRPQKGDKVIFNAKKDQDIIGEPWVQFIDTDTTSGHGTHCAGTVGGTGAAAAGAKAGIAPNAWLIGLSMGELFMTIDEYSGLEWVYEHSRPGDNPANIRVVTNSWGPGWPFDALDPNELSSQMIDKIVTENNVAVIFAAGNDGSDNHDGSSDTTNIFAKVPVSIGVAATQRDGSGLATFTSRGDVTMNETWPDVGAPGVGIWAPAARVTMIGAATMGSDIISLRQHDPYYMAISGTSMATPHVAGLTALLWQACPSLTMSDVVEDGHTADETGLSPFMHETEVILKATADYIEQDGDNGVPDSDTVEIGLLDRPYDYAQGYGMVNSTKAVAVALMLDKMRDTDHDGKVDNEDVTVFDAIKKYESILMDRFESRSVDVITTSFEGQFVHPWEVIDTVLNQSAPMYGRRIPHTNLYKTLYIPEDALDLHIVMDIDQLSGGLNVADLYITIDVDGDGDEDWTPDGEPNPLAIQDQKEWYIHISTGFMSDWRGRPWGFNVTGTAWGWDPEDRFGAHFEVEIEVILDSVKDPTVDYAPYRFGTRTDNYGGGETTLHLYYFDLRSDQGDDDDSSVVFDMVPMIIGLMAVAGVAYFILTKRKDTTE